MPDWIPYSPWALLLKASWQGAVIIVLVLAALYVLGRRLTPRWRCALWLLVVLRLAMPWTVPSALSPELLT
jgi:bla regulator protein BlaR1